MIRNQQQIFAIKPEFYILLHSFMVEKSRELPFRFRKVKPEHIRFIKKLMGRQETRNLTIAQKTGLLNREFAVNLSTGTISKI